MNASCEKNKHNGGLFAAYGSDAIPLGIGTGWSMLADSGWLRFGGCQEAR